MREDAFAALAASLVLSATLAFTVGSPAPAQDLSGCASAYVKDDPEDQIRLYTICLERGQYPGGRYGGYNNRGSAYMAIGEIDRALADFTSAINNDDTWGTAYLNRARVYLAKGELALAEADLDAVVRRRPADIRGFAHVLRAQIKATRGDQDGALDDLRSAIERRYRNAGTLNSVAWFYATFPDASYRNGEEAIRLALSAVEIENNPAIRDTLAAAYAEAGRFEDAVREQRAVIETLEAAEADVREFAERLALYESGQPYREPALELPPVSSSASP